MPSEPKHTPEQVQKPVISLESPDLSSFLRPTEHRIAEAADQLKQTTQPYSELPESVREWAKLLFDALAEVLTDPDAFIAHLVLRANYQADGPRLDHEIITKACREGIWVLSPQQVHVLLTSDIDGIQALRRAAERWLGGDPEPKPE